MCHLSLFTQPPPLKNDCWWLRKLWSLRVGWQDCHSSPTRTLHQQETFMHSPLHRSHDCLFVSTHRIYLVLLLQMHSPLHACTEHSRTSNSRLRCCLFTHAWAGSCSSSCVNQCPFIILTHRNFLVFRLMQRAESRALPSTNCCEGPFTFLAVSQTGMVM